MLLGELGALAAGFIWACTSILFTAAGRQAPPVATNFFKTAAATLLFSLVLLVRIGAPWDASLGWYRVGMLALSGLLGFSAGDSMLFLGYQILGTRRAMLVQGLNPVLGAWWAWMFLQETLGWQAIGGMALALGGTAVVISDGLSAIPVGQRGRVGRGVLYGLGAAAGQASGALFAKAVLEGVDVFAATQVRVAGGAVTLALLALLRGELGSWVRLLSQRSVLWRVGVGSLFGPFVAVWLMVYGLQNAPTGIVLTLLSLSPVWLLPLGAMFQGDRPTARESLGAVVAVGGVAILLLR